MNILPFFQGYILNTRKRPEMFSEDRITTIFGNMEELFALAVRFLEDLEKCYNAEEPHKTEFGQCFVNHVSISFLVLIHISRLGLLAWNILRKGIP